MQSTSSGAARRSMGVRRVASPRGARPNIQPAPHCLPEARVPVTVAFKDTRSALVCSVVRVEAASRQILLAVSDKVHGSPHLHAGSQVVIGWPGHNTWHEARATKRTKPGSRYFWLKVTHDPIHRERRRFVRANQTRPIAITSGRRIAQATTMDLSEAATRVSMNLGESIFSGDKVHVVFKAHHRFRGELVPVAIDGVVQAIRSTDEGTAGRKEAVIFFEHIGPAQEDYLRGLVYDLHLQEKKPAVLHN